MEQMRQAPLDFGDTEHTPKTPVDFSVLSHEEVVTMLSTLDRTELTAGYQRFVGKDPMFRNLSDEELRAGIINPEAELRRLAVIDLQEDQAERRRGRK